VGLCMGSLNSGLPRHLEMEHFAFLSALIFDKNANCLAGIGLLRRLCVDIPYYMFL
jgi:hypothetical protein